MCLLFARTGASLLLYPVRICAFDISFKEPSFVGIYFFTHNYRVLLFPFDITDIHSIFVSTFFTHLYLVSTRLGYFLLINHLWNRYLSVSTYFTRRCLVFGLQDQDIFFCNIIYKAVFWQCLLLSRTIT